MDSLKSSWRTSHIHFVSLSLSHSFPSHEGIFFKSKSTLPLSLWPLNALSLWPAQYGVMGFPLSLSLAERNLSSEDLIFIFPSPYHLCSGFSFKERNSYIVLILCAR